MIALIVLLSCLTTKSPQNVDQHRELPKALNAALLHFKKLKWVCGNCDTVLIDPIIQIDTTCDYTYGKANLAYYYSEIDTISIPGIKKSIDKIYYSSIRQLKNRKYSINAKKLDKRFHLFSSKDSILKNVNVNFFKVFQFSPLISTGSKDIFYLWATKNNDYHQVGYSIRLEKSSMGYDVKHLSYNDELMFSAQPDYIGN